MMNSHRLESSFFSESKELTMYITGVEWLDKDMQRLRLDLKNVQADKLPQNCLFERAEKKEKGWLLTFIGKQYEEESSHQICKAIIMMNKVKNIISTVGQPIVGSGMKKQINMWSHQVPSV